MLLIAAVYAFFWAVKHDQFDDLDNEASRILFEEDSDKVASPKPQEKS